MGHGHWRLAAWGLVVPAAVAALAGCSGSGSSGGGTASVSAAQKALAGTFSGTDLSGALLSKVNGVGATGPVSKAKYAALPVTAAGLIASGSVTPQSCAGVAVQGFDPAGLSALQAATVGFKVSGNMVTETLVASSAKPATAAMAAKLPATCKTYEAKSGGKTVKYTVTEQPLDGVALQAKALGMTAASKADNQWSIIYRGKGFVGRVTVTGPNASEKAAQQLAAQAYAYAAKTLT
jgi:hypothetical protein